MSLSKLIFGMMQSLDGYIDGSTSNVQLGSPGPILFRHFADYVRDLNGIVYGRRMYEVMRYWDEDQPGWDESEKCFAPRSLKSVDSNGTLVKAI